MTSVSTSATPRLSHSLLVASVANVNGEVTASAASSMVLRGEPSYPTSAVAVF